MAGQWHGQIFIFKICRFILFFKLISFFLVRQLQAGSGTDQLDGRELAAELKIMNYCLKILS
jgi:hypothetical protein